MNKFSWTSLLKWYRKTLWVFPLLRFIVAHKTLRVWFAITAVFLLPLLLFSQLGAQAERPFIQVLYQTTLNDTPDSEQMTVQFIGTSDVETAVFATHTMTPTVWIANQKYEWLGNEPFYIAVLIDSSGSMSGKNIAETKKQVRHLIENAPENGQFSLISFTGQLDQGESIPFTSDKEALYDTLEQITVQIEDPTCLYDATYAAVQSLTEFPVNGRRAIVVLTDGQDQIHQGDSEQCSTQDKLAAKALAAEPKIPIPIHTIRYPYMPTENAVICQETAVTRKGTLVNGYKLTCGGGRAFNDDLLYSFTHQWQLLVDLYTEATPIDLSLTSGIDWTETHTVTAQFAHFPSTVAEAIGITNITYHEYEEQGANRNQRGAFNIDFQLCPISDIYCDPAKITAVHISIEDTFSNQIVAQNDLFVRSSETIQTLPLPTNLLADHHYFIRAEARDLLTPSRHYPSSETIFNYRPQLTLTVHKAYLRGGFTFQPELVVEASAERIAHADGSNLLTNQPQMLDFGGYLVYQNEAEPEELHALPLKRVSISDERFVYTAQVPSGWGVYDLYLTAQDETGGVTGVVSNNFLGNTAVVTEAVTTQAETAWGRLMVRGRALLIRPYLALIALLLFLFLFLLIYLAIRLGRYFMFKEPKQKEKIQPKPDHQGLQMIIRATPDETLRGQTFTLNYKDFPYSIGRIRDNHLTLERDETIAQRHAAILHQANGDKTQPYYIINHDDRYSTFINDAKIITGVPVPFSPNTDRIQIGEQTRLEFKLDQPHEQSK